MPKSKKIQGPAASTEQLIPLNRLKKSPRNARKTPHPAAHIEALASSIAAHGMLQAPVVEPEMKDNKPTGYYLVTIGEGRRQALLLRAKRKQIAKDQPVRCLIETGHDAFEISLAENAIRSSMHPADQFDAFYRLSTENGLSAEDIAARFGVTPAVVKQRLKLASVSPKLIQAYREDKLTLDQLTAFAITDDHTRQERVFENLRPSDDRGDILEALNDGHVPASDPRAIFVGREAYVAAGGGVLADLFDDEHEGFFTDAGLLSDLAVNKLQAADETVKAEGWKWVVVLPRMDYGAVESCRRTYPEPRALNDEEAAQLAALEEQYEALEVEDGSEEGDAERTRLEAAIDTLTEAETYAPEAVARGGAIVTLAPDGTLAVHRGFVRPEDDPKRPAEHAAKKDDPAQLPEKLVAELTASRTSLLRNELARQPTTALLALLHSLTEQAFYNSYERTSCLGLRLVAVRLQSFVPGIAESDAEKEIAARHASWVRLLPEEVGGLWDVLAALTTDDQLALLAHCTSLTLDGVQQPKQPPKPFITMLADKLGFDMAAHWSPSPANYFGRVSKQRILDAVREGVSKEAAENLASLKKDALAQAASERLAGKRWLPSVLRNPACKEQAAA